MLLVLLPILFAGVSTPDEESPAPTSRVLRFISVAPMDTYGDDYENDSGMPLVADNDQLTAWKSESCVNGALNKPGMGMLFDLGSPGTVTGFRLQTPSPGYRFTVVVGEDPTSMVETASEKVHSRLGYARIDRTGDRAVRPVVDHHRGPYQRRKSR